MSSTTEAMLRYTTGKGYIETAKYAATSPHRDSPERESMTLLPLSMLAGFALELFFKAWLLNAGIESKKVRKFGHDITSLYAEAKVENLPSISQLDEVVGALSAGHEDYTFRYMEDGQSVNDINWPATFGILTELANAVDEKIGASASQGLKPGH